MLLLNSKNIELFLDSKLDEITTLIKNNYNKSPETIAKLIVKGLDCSKMPLSLLTK